MDLNYPPSAKKLICDTLLLLFVSRQALVFRIERRYPKDYPGGMNDSVFHLAEEKDFINPVPDFVTYARFVQTLMKLWNICLVSLYKKINCQLEISFY